MSEPSGSSDPAPAPRIAAGGVGRSELAEFRFRYHHGRPIVTHRALRRIEPRGRDIAVGLLMGTVLTAGWLFVLRWVGEWWAHGFALGQALTGLGGEVWIVRAPLDGFLTMALPVPVIEARLPSRLDFWASGIAVLVLLVLSFLVPRPRVPLRYLLRVIAVVHGSAVVTYAFIVPPAYSASGYLGVMVAASMMVLALVPLALALLFYIFDLGLARKIALTLLLAGHLAVFVPLQYLGHALVLRSLSLLFMPVLYVLFGLLLNVLIFVAFYGWAMSWPPLDPQPRKLGRWRARSAAGLLALTCSLAPAAAAAQADPPPGSGWAEPAVPLEPPRSAIDAGAGTSPLLAPVPIREVTLRSWREWAEVHVPRPIRTPLWLDVAWRVLLAIVVVICVFAARHYVFTIQRLIGRQRHPYTDIDALDWPGVSVVVPAHNEEDVIERIVTAILEVDYPQDRLDVLIIDHRSTDRTPELLRELERAHPGRFRWVHAEGGGGKPVALLAATELARHDILLVFDADYEPGRALIKQLAAPFVDPEVGAVMGRVVPRNVGRKLLTRLLDLERAGGYQVDQQARMNLNLLPQFGGTVGGVRRRALEDVGGWNAASLTEDTDLTLRLVIRGWSVVYQNRSECYEEVVEEWPDRLRQVRRWAIGHNDVARAMLSRLFTSRYLSPRQKADGALLLAVYLVAPLTMFGWLLALIIFYAGLAPYVGLVAILAVASYATLGNFAPFYENATAARLDRTYGRIRLLPFLLVGFLASLFTISRAPIHVVRGVFAPPLWDKSPRIRRGSESP